MVLLIAKRREQKNPSCGKVLCVLWAPRACVLKILLQIAKGCLLMEPCDAPWLCIGARTLRRHGGFMLLSNSLETNFTWKFEVTRKDYSRAESCLWQNKAYQDYKATAPNLHGSHYIPKVWIDSLILFKLWVFLHRRFDLFVSSSYSHCATDRGTKILSLLFLSWPRKHSPFCQGQKMLIPVSNHWDIACKYLLSKPLTSCN